MRKKNKKLKIIVVLLSLVMVGSIGYIGYRQIGEPMSKNQKYGDLRDEYGKGDLKFKLEENEDNSSITELEDLDSSQGNITENIKDDSSSNHDNNDTSSNNSNEYVNRNSAEQQKSTNTENYSDMIGWLSIPNTNINYPVMYKKNDNNFYLTHDYRGNYDSYGSIYLDGEQWVNARNMTLFGHNINAYYRSMFHEIVNFENQYYLEQHPTVKFDTGTKNSEWEVIGCLVVDLYSNAYSYNRCEFANDDEFVSYTNDLLSKCVSKKQGITINKGDQLLTLSTCSYHSNNCRTVLICRKSVK